jgi:hypothetical protein
MLQVHFRLFLLICHLASRTLFVLKLCYWNHLPHVVSAAESSHIPGPAQRVGIP